MTIRSALALAAVILMMSACSTAGPEGVAAENTSCSGGGTQLGLALATDANLRRRFDTRELVEAMFERNPRYRYVHTELSGLCGSAILLWNSDFPRSNPNPRLHGLDALTLLRFPDTNGAISQFDHLATTENASGELLLEQIDVRTWLVVRGLPNQNTMMLHGCLVGVATSTADNDDYVASARALLEALAVRTC